MVRVPNPGVGRDFPDPTRPVLKPTQPHVQRARGHFPAGKAAGVER